MNDEFSRDLVDGLKRLDLNERLAKSGIAKLREDLKDLCRRMNALIRGDIGQEILSIREDNHEGQGWRLNFNERPVLDFQITMGKVEASPKPTVARCEVRQADDGDWVRVLHCVCVNDHTEWEFFSGDRAGTVPVSTKALADLLTPFVQRELKKYPA